MADPMEKSNHLLTTVIINITGYYLNTHLSKTIKRTSLLLTVCLFQWHGPLSFNLFCPGHPGPNPDLSGNLQLQLLYMIMPINNQKLRYSIRTTEQGMTVVIFGIASQEALKYHNK